MKIGYARVSTIDQNLALQHDALQQANCDKIFEDKMSGTKTDKERPGLAEALKMLRKDDTLTIWKLDRLGRSTRNLIEIVGELREKGINFKCLSPDIDTKTPTGRFFFHNMAALAELERDIISERTSAGLAAARARGRFGGRPLKLTPKTIRLIKAMHTDKNNSIKDICEAAGVCRAVVYRALKINLEEENGG